MINPKLMEGRYFRTTDPNVAMDYAVWALINKENWVIGFVGRTREEIFSNIEIIKNSLDKCNKNYDKSNRLRLIVGKNKYEVVPFDTHPYGLHLNLMVCDLRNYDKNDKDIFYNKFFSRTWAWKGQIILILDKDINFDSGKIEWIDLDGEIYS